MSPADPTLSVGWTGQLRKGVLDLAILEHLARDEVHGYALIAALKEEGLMAAEGGAATVYQALQRLAAQGLAASSWSAPTAGDNERPRKVYTITKRGLAARKEMAAEWRQLRASVDRLLEDSR